MKQNHCMDKDIKKKLKNKRNCRSFSFMKKKVPTSNWRNQIKEQRHFHIADYIDLPLTSTGRSISGPWRPFPNELIADILLHCCCARLDDGKTKVSHQVNSISLNSIQQEDKNQRNHTNL